MAPKASRNGVGLFYEDSDGLQRLKVMVTAVPEGGKANEAVIKLLAKYLKLPKSALEIVSGALDRRKTLKIRGEGTILSQHLREQE